MDRWADRANAAEKAVLGRHLRSVFGLPTTALGVVSWPPRPAHRLFFRWHFWWQAHLLDCAVDAWLRAPNARRAQTVVRIARSIRVRNLGRFTNDYYDDMAWIGLALLRAGAVGIHTRAMRHIVTEILDAWAPPTGGIPWRRGDEFYNAPANAPAAILLARTGFPNRARQMADWMDDHLRLPSSDLIADGFHPGDQLKPHYYSYNQGGVIGAEVELAARDDRRRVHRLVAAVAAEMTSSGVLIGHGGGDGGLFTGILARYLCLVCTRLTGSDATDRHTRSVAARLVLDSAASAWQNRAAAPHGPLFGPDWTVPARSPASGRTGRKSGATVESSAQPERDLSVQLSGWMLLEAAAVLERSGAPERLT